MKKIFQILSMLSIVSSYSLFGMAPVPVALQAALFARVPQVAQQNMVKKPSIYDQLLQEQLLNQRAKPSYSVQQVKDWMESSQVSRQKPWIDTSELQDIAVPRKTFTAPPGGMFKVTRSMMMSWTHQTSPYDILKVGQNVTSDNLKKSYRKASMENHPDVGGSEEAMKLINQAYDFIKDLLQKGQSYTDEQHQQNYQQQQAQASDYQEKYQDLPSDKAPEGEWQFVGSWKETFKQKPVFSGNAFGMRFYSTPGITEWERVLTDKQGVEWLQTARFKESNISDPDENGMGRMSFSKMVSKKYDIKPKLGWNWYIEKQYSALGKHGVKSLLQDMDAYYKYKKFLKQGLGKVMPEYIVLPNIKKVFYRDVKKLLENYFELLNAARPTYKKFDPYNIKRTGKEEKELQEVAEETKKILHTLYPELKEEINETFSNIEKLKKMTDGLNKMKAKKGKATVSFSVNTVNVFMDILNNNFVIGLLILKAWFYRLLFGAIAYKGYQYATKSDESVDTPELQQKRKELAEILEYDIGDYWEALQSGLLKHYLNRKKQK